MKKLNLFIILTCLFLMASSLQAQLMLDVEGDAAVSGKFRIGNGVATPATPLSIMGNGGTLPVGITQKHVAGAGTATMEFTTADADGDQTTRLLLRGDLDGGDIEFYRGARGSEERSVHIEGDNGNVGIGISAPLTDMHLKQSDNDESSSGGMTFENVNNNYKWKIYHSGINLSFAENIGADNTTGVRRGYIEGATGTYVVTSDGRFKKNVEEVKENILSKVLKLQPKRYNYKDAKEGQKKTLGFIAQEVQKLFPDIVHETEDKTLGLSYAEFGILAIKAIQELSAKEADQEKEIEGLQQKIGEVVIQKETITTQQTQINDQQQQIDELKSLVEKLLTQKAENPQGSNYELNLKKTPALNQNQPNPFRENTLVNYFIPTNAKNAHIQVTSIDGKILGTVKIQEKGQGQVTIKAATYPAGTYFYSLIVDGEVFETKRMVLTK